MNTYNAENHALNLPDKYRKTSDSNNAKILEIERLEGVKIRESLYQVEAILDINNATGKTLDLYGGKVGQPRGSATDEQYRIMIKAKVSRDLCNGSIPSIVNALAETFGCDKSEIQLKEAEKDCTVELVTLPLDTLVTAGFSLSQITALIKTIIPIGVTVETLMYEGTLEFSDSEEEYDENAGFTDTEGGATGGYFGYLAGEETETVLPI